jgi:predicted O-linked N-acetylglucosamine transferase (SPINDLY family)
MPLKRFAEAEAALGAGRRDEGIALVGEQLELDPHAPVSVYRNYTAMLIRHKRYEEAARWAQVGVEIHPREFDLWNNLGVAMRRLLRFPEALEALDKAQKVNPKNIAPQINKGNIYNDMRDGPASIATWTKLVRASPANAEYQRGLGRGYWYSADLPKAEMRFRLATKLKPDFIDAWLDLVAVVGEQRDVDDSLAVIDEAFRTSPFEPRLCETKAVLMRRSGRHKDAEVYLLSLVDRFGDQAWMNYQLSVAISEWDRLRAHEYMERAIELDPENLEYRMGLAESLGRTRIDESAMLEKAYAVLGGSLDKVEMNPIYLKIATEILTRIGDYDAADALADFKEMGRTFAESGKHTALLAHLARAKTAEDRVELVEQHRIWGDKVLERVSLRPIKRPPPRTPNGKIRLGFMSSDLRAHPVAYFALPLFEHYDRSRFEIYCYSYYLHDEDSLQARIRGMVDVFRWKKETTDRDAAQMIADDQLDMLIELGGSTHMNKLGVMAYKPAPLQASWLGYPHSAGLTTIDHFILDPYVAPKKRELVLEEPLLMPRSWIAMGELAFPNRPITAEIPETRNGFLTFGTANNPYKYSKAMVQAWARVTAAVPDSRFMFVRPEGGAPTFRRHIEALFAAEGVSADRVVFQDIRGAHMPFYNEIDISLDTFPQTGGTTTCEALFMGVPVVSLVGDAVFERLSYSILSNAGLGDLCAFNEDEFLKIALTLAGDAPRRQMLRTELRGMLKASPLGQTQQFATDFYAMIEGAVTKAKAKVAETA